VVKLPEGSVVSATEAMLDTFDLDETGLAKAAVLLALARKLDACADKDPVGGDPMAGLAKEWRELVDSILEASGRDGGFVSGLFAEVGDSSH
jgi:hypothetical protein